MRADTSIIDKATNAVTDLRVEETLASLPEAVVITVALVGVALALLRRTWAVVGYPVTIVHELGHAVAAVTAGYRLQGITVNGDMSGATNFWARGALGSLWTLWWGYPTPAAVGAALIWSAGSGWARIALAVLVAALLLVFLLSRSWHTVGVVLATGVFFGLVGWFGSGLVATLVVYAFGWLLIVGSVRALSTVTRTHVTREGVEGSDAYMMGRRIRILPGPFWLLTFAAGIGAATWYAATTLIDAVAA